MSRGLSKPISVFAKKMFNCLNSLTHGMKPSDLKCHALRDAVFTGCVKCQVECWTCRSFKVTLPSRCTYRNEKKPNKKKEKSYVGLEAQPQEERSGTSHLHTTINQHIIPLKLKSLRLIASLVVRPSCLWLVEPKRN